MEEKNSEPFGKTFLSLFITIVIIYLLFYKNDLERTIYPICILFSFLVVVIISGKIEINFGEIIKIKKDTEGIKKDISEIKMIMSNTQKQNQKMIFYNVQSQPYPEGKVVIEEDKALDAKDLPF